MRCPEPTYIFGAVCTPEGKGAALALPFCNTAGMSQHLAEISLIVSPGKHAVLLLDQAGWHVSAALDVPANITLLPLPAECPELNVMVNVWQFMRDNWLPNRVFRDHDDIVAQCCRHSTLCGLAGLDTEGAFHRRQATPRQDQQSWQ